MSTPPCALSATDIAAAARCRGLTAQAVAESVLDRLAQIGGTLNAFRAARAGGSPQRTLSNTVITTFDQDFAPANTEFQRVDNSRSGRQSQTWARTDDGWRVVCAHISFPTEGS